MVRSGAVFFLCESRLENFALHRLWFRVQKSPLRGCFSRGLISHNISQSCVVSSRGGEVWTRVDFMRKKRDIFSPSSHPVHPSPFFSSFPIALFTTFHKSISTILKMHIPTNTTPRMIILNQFFWPFWPFGSTNPKIPASLPLLHDQVRSGCLLFKSTVVRYVYSFTEQHNLMKQQKWAKKNDQANLFGSKTSHNEPGHFYHFKYLRKMGTPTNQSAQRGPVLRAGNNTKNRQKTRNAPTTPNCSIPPTNLPPSQPPTHFRLNDRVLPRFPTPCGHQSTTHLTIPLFWWKSSFFFCTSLDHPPPLLAARLFLFSFLSV